MTEPSSGFVNSRALLIAIILIVEGAMGSFDFRTELFRLRVPIYKAASEVDVHPSRLSLYLNGRVPMPPAVHDRLKRVIARHHEAARHV